MKNQGILLLTVLLFFYSFSQAQVRVGILAGPSSSNIVESNSANNWKSRLGFHAGAIADVPLSQKLYFQPGVIFSNKGAKFTESFDTTTHDTAWHSYSRYINYIDIPLNLVLKFPLGKKTKFIIGAGPYVSFFYNGKENEEYSYKNGDYTTNEVKDLPVGKGQGKYKTFDYGLNGLAGFEMGRVFLTANYSRSLGNFYENGTSELKHQVIGGTLGVFLGKQVKAEPKKKDKDKDGVEDKDDACPTEAGTAITNGCPDKDGDGVTDKDDKCPAVAGLKKYNGCPIPDTDGDGINDEEDKCSTVAGIKKYNGCPIPDTDGDGINDEEDKCPNLAGLKKYNGCLAPDSDGDGVSDEDDKCPQTRGTKENGGCPEIKKELVEKINYAARQIQFEYTKATIQKKSYSELDQVVKILQQDASLTLSIEGHTSNDGILSANMKLSQARADNVKAYFISKGIDAARLKAEGFGPNKLLNSGKTEADKAKNRRVELKLSNR